MNETEIGINSKNRATGGMQNIEFSPKQTQTYFIKSTLRGAAPNRSLSASSASSAETAADGAATTVLGAPDTMKEGSGLAATAAAGAGAAAAGVS